MGEDLPMVMVTGGTPVLDGAGGRRMDDYRLGSALNGLVEGLGLFAHAWSLVEKGEGPA